MSETPTTDIERLVDRLHRATLLFGRRGLGMFAISGVELALWDLAGQARGVPVYELLGGLVQPRIPAYASLARFDRPADVARAAAAAVAAVFLAVGLVVLYAVAKLVRRGWRRYKNRGSPPSVGLPASP